MRLGFGIYAYLNMMYQLIFVFIGLTILAIPSFVFYSQNDAYKQYTTNLETGALERVPGGNEVYSLGNLGYSSTQCVHAPLDVGSMSLMC